MPKDKPLNSGSVWQVYAKRVVSVNGSTLIKIVMHHAIEHDDVRLFFINDVDDEIVPKIVEDWLLNEFLMGPTWSWKLDSADTWRGEFASIDNHKVKDSFCFYNNLKKNNKLV